VASTEHHPRSPWSPPRKGRILKVVCGCRKFGVAIIYMGETGTEPARIWWTNSRGWVIEEFEM